MNQQTTPTRAELPRQMLAVEISQPGAPSVLRPATRETPEPRKGEILIRTRAAGVNRPDLLQRQGAYPPPPGASDLPGLEVAGEVVAVGKGVRRWQVGDAVTALTPGGGYAEYCRTHEDCALPVPPGLSFEEAATLPETFFTVWFNAFQICRLKPGETLLVHGGSSGIGTAAIQIAAALGVTVIATAGSAPKCDACVQLGATLAVNYREDDFVAATLDRTGGRGADVILDMVGGPYVARNYRAAAHGGRISQIALLEGMVAETDFATMMIKQIMHTGSMLRPQPVEVKAAIARELEARIWPLIESGSIVPVLDTVYALDEAWRAHARMEGGDHIGKLALTTDSAVPATGRAGPGLARVHRGRRT